MEIFVIIFIIGYFIINDDVYLTWKLKKIIRTIVIQNFDILFNNLQKAYYKNEYGYIDKNSLIKEIKRFVEIVVISNARVKKIFHVLIKKI